MDKNSLAFFEIKDNKLYLYTPETLQQIQKLKEAEAQKKELEKSIENLEKEKGFAPGELGQPQKQTAGCPPHAAGTAVPSVRAR